MTNTELFEALRHVRGGKAIMYTSELSQWGYIKRTVAPYCHPSHWELTEPSKKILEIAEVYKEYADLRRQLGVAIEERDLFAADAKSAEAERDELKRLLDGALLERSAFIDDVKKAEDSHATTRSILFKVEEDIAKSLNVPRRLGLAELVSAAILKIKEADAARPLVKAVFTAIRTVEYSMPDRRAKAFGEAWDSKSNRCDAAEAGLAATRIDLDIARQQLADLPNGEPSRMGRKAIAAIWQIKRSLDKWRNRGMSGHTAWADVVRAVDVALVEAEDNSSPHDATTARQALADLAAAKAELDTAKAEKARAHADWRSIRATLLQQRDDAVAALIEAKACLRRIVQVKRAARRLDASANQLEAAALRITGEGSGA